MVKKAWWLLLLSLSVGRVFSLAQISRLRIEYIRICWCVCWGFIFAVIVERVLVASLLRCGLRVVLLAGRLHGYLFERVFTFLLFKGIDR